jgi:hypothetical protein
MRESQKFQLWDKHRDKLWGKLEQKEKEIDLKTISLEIHPWQSSLQETFYADQAVEIDKFVLKKWIRSTLQDFDDGV